MRTAKHVLLIILLTFQSSAAFSVVRDPLDPVRDCNPNDRRSSPKIVAHRGEGADEDVSRVRVSSSDDKTASTRCCVVRSQGKPLSFRLSSGWRPRWGIKGSSKDPSSSRARFALNLRRIRALLVNPTDRIEARPRNKYRGRWSRRDIVIEGETRDRLTPNRRITGCRVGWRGLAQIGTLSVLHVHYCPTVWISLPFRVLYIHVKNEELASQTDQL